MVGRRVSARTALLAVALSAWAVLLVAQVLPRAVGEPLAWGVMSVTALVACGAMLRRSQRATGRLRQARLLVALALVAGAAAGLLAVLWVPLTGSPPPDVSLVDAVHLCFLPLVVVGLLRYPVTDEKAGSTSRALLDGAVAAGALWFLAHTVLLGPSDVGDGLPLATQLVVLAHPAANVFVLGMLASVLPRVARPARRELVLTGSGFALYAVSDLGYSVLTTVGTYRADSWVSVVAQAGLLLLLAGTRAPEGTSDAVSRAGRALTVLPHLPVVAGLAVGTGVAAAGGVVQGTQLMAAIVLVAGLFLRQLISTRDRDDLTERLQSREELFRSLVTGGSDLIVLVGKDGVVSWASPSVSRAFDLPEDQLVGSALRDVVDAEDRDRLREAFAGVVQEPGAEAEVLARIRSGGEERWMQVLLTNHLADASVRGVVVNARDVHERHVLERQLAHAAFHDALTGLGNLAQARAVLRACYDGPRAATVVLVDLDGFKAVNDTFGHAHGDALLCRVAERLRSCVRSSDMVSRIGGDEFVLVLDAVEDAAAVCERVLVSLRAPVVVAGTRLSVRASLGVALTADAASPDELLRNADLAMYSSKAAGRDRTSWYAPAMHSTAAARMALHEGLRTAMVEDELSLHYQPIVRLPDGAVVGVEALLRWQSAEHGAVAPDVFIPVAEESGLIGEIDVWVLEQACRDIAAWRADGLDVPRVSINVSRRHMTLDLPGLVSAALGRHGLRGADLCIEVTESAVVPDAEAASQALTEVRRLGVTVALDDFGSGQSSLSQLARLPVDSVKIDRSFTQSAASDPAALRLLTSIVGVCQALALPVVAEGVEQAELADFLAGIGCDRGQGFHFGRPQPAAGFRTLLQLVSDPALLPPLDSRLGPVLHPR